MNKKQRLSLTLLGCLLLFALAIPFSNAMTATEGDYYGGQGPFYYHASPVAANYDSYVGGFLYNALARAIISYISYFFCRLSRTYFVTVHEEFCLTARITIKKTRMPLENRFGS